MSLTYRTEKIVKKIQAPIICVIDGVEIEYENGAAMYAHEFGKNYQVESFSARDRKIVVALKDWTAPYADSNAPFAKECKKKYGEEVSFF